eukprot:1037526-Amphidinium_carterae.1
MLAMFGNGLHVRIELLKLVLTSAHCCLNGMQLDALHSGSSLSRISKVPTVTCRFRVRMVVLESYFAAWKGVNRAKRSSAA